jgi:glyoxylase-like metal-dependent hydrolase (beta-lactamase superfamily II)
MGKLKQRVLHGLADVLGGLQVRTEEVAGGIAHIRVSSRVTRANRMEVSLYLLGSTLIDTGFVHGQAALVPFLAKRSISTICLTHHHEDHSGVAGIIAAHHGCPIYLRNVSHRFEEGLSALKPYRLLWWGEPAPHEPLEMPERITTDHGVLHAVPIPGHAATHTALFDEASGVVFTGDLFITGGVTAVMSHENPYQSITSLRRVASLSPRWMLTGHARIMEAPASALLGKADRIERAAAEVLRLHAERLSTAEIVKRLFPKGRLEDRRIALLTGGEFSRANFVRACTRHAP